VGHSKRSSRIKIFDFDVFGLKVIRWPCEKPVIKGRQERRITTTSAGPWQTTFTPRGPGSGSQIKNRDGFQLRSQIFSGTLTRKSSLPLSTTGERLVHESTRFFLSPAQATSDYPTRTSFQEITVDTTVRAIKEGQDDLPPLRNPPLLETADDLATLSHLNEPSGVLCPFG
jgi:hypothetical protein